jgi:mono/diheme cytochrome c family protein
MQQGRTASAKCTEGRPLRAVAIAVLFLCLGICAPAENPPFLAWDAMSKENTAKAGDTNLHYFFNFTNVYGKEVVIQAVTTSCGCTVARLPQIPWALAPGTNGQIEVVFDARGKWGTITKAVFVQTTRGVNVLNIIAKMEPRPPVPNNLPPAPPLPGRSTFQTTAPANREKNMELAKGDRQAVFKKDCAWCHADPAHGKTGPQLYTVACGICHDSQNRAQMVPDLHHLNHPTDVEYWKQWIAHGKEGTLMPAFSNAEGGPLDPAQVASLVEFLSSNIQGLSGKK